MQLYVISYKPGERGCPVNPKGTLNHKWEWNQFDPNPEKLTITHDYEYFTKNPLYDFDFWTETLIASEAFCDLCDQFGARTRRIPLRIIQSNKKATTKTYFYLLWQDWLSIIDFEKSDYQILFNPQTGKKENHLYFPEIPYIETLAKFVPVLDKTKGKHVFKCLDLISEVVCTDDFRQACIDRKFIGLDFIPIEEFQMFPFLHK